ncbi:hypothetical protein Tco_0739313 [Tanacetum coccineum]
MGSEPGRWEFRAKGLEYGRYGVSKVLDTAYWEFLGVGTTFDIFQNILFPYSLNTAYCLLLDMAYWILFPSWSLILGSLSQDVYLGHVFFDNASIVWNELKETYDRVDGSIAFNLLQKINSFKQGGLHVCLDDIYHLIRSSLLTKEILPEVKDAFVMVAREERNTNGNWNSSIVNNGNKGNYNSMLCKNCGLKDHTIDMCFEIISHLPSFKRNPNLKSSNSFNNNINNNADVRGSFVGNNEINTSTGTLSFTNDQVLKLMSLLNDKSRSTAHANTTELNNDIVLFDVLVVLEYCVDLLSVHKLIKDSKFDVDFDETKCYIQDLKKERVIGTGI